MFALLYIRNRNFNIVSAFLPGDICAWSDLSSIIPIHTGSLLLAIVFLKLILLHLASFEKRALAFLTWLPLPNN